MASTSRSCWHSGGLAAADSPAATLSGVPVDHFPSTHATWIDAQLTIAERGRSAGDAAVESNALAALRQHLMERYHGALRAYVGGSGLRRLREPDELVGGFFADRACKPAFLEAWRASGLPLRRWMMTGINLYGKSLVREATRNREKPAGTIDEGSLVDMSTAERAFERAWALAVLNAALSRVHGDLAAQGRLDDYGIFRRRVIDGQGYDAIAPEVGRTHQQCANATRLVTDRLREALRAVLRDEGLVGTDLDLALGEVYEAFGIGKRAEPGS